MSKVEYFNDICAKYLGQYKSMNDAVAAYIIDHVDWTPAAEFLAHNDIHEAAVMNDLEQQDDPDDEALDIDTETSTVEEGPSARSKYSPSSTSTTEGILGVTGTLN